MQPKSGTSLVATLLTLIALSACSGKSASHQTLAPAGGGPSSVATSPAAPATGAPAGSAAARAKAAASSAASAQGNATSSVPPSAATRPGATAAKPPGTPTGLARAGNYVYDLSGTAKQPIGGNATVAGTQTYTVDPPSGSSQHAQTTDQQGSQDMTVQSKSSGLYVVDIHISQQGFNQDFRPVGSALYFPASYHTGSRWSWSARSTDGRYSLSVVSKLSGATNVTVHGSSLKALIVDSTLHITGSGFDITDSQRDWVSTTYALILQEHAVTNGKAYGASFSSNVTRKLRSTTPS